MLFFPAKLSSCLDQLHSILGETCHEPTAVEAVLKYNFDVEKALDDILNGGILAIFNFNYCFL